MRTKILDQDAHRHLVTQRVQLLKDRPFFGNLLLHLFLEEDLGTPTMGTDGVGLYYNPTYVRLLGSRQLQAILLHEVLHCALGHLWRRGGRDIERWNRATDYAVNTIVVTENFDLPSGMLYREEFCNMEAEKIYPKLPAEPEGAPWNSHERWIRSHRRAEKSGSGSGVGKSAEEIWRQRVARAAHAARMQGKLPSSVSALVKDILEPRLDWRVILRDTVVSFSKNDFRWSPPAKKHLWQDTYLPSVCAEELVVAVGVDSSGSISEKEYQEFLAEVRGIGEQFADCTIHLFFCDADIHKRLTLSRQDAWPQMFPKNDGGTSFVPVFEAIERENLQIASLVYLTDGRGDYPMHAPSYPVIWVLNSDYEDTPWGETVRLEA